MNKDTMLSVGGSISANIIYGVDLLRTTLSVGDETVVYDTYDTGDTVYDSLEEVIYG